MAYIEEDKINEIRNSVNIVDIIKEYVPLTSKGKNFFGVCPFHEDHAPSMSVSSDKQIFRCFSCGAAGNVFTFVKDYENISFLEAVSMVAKKAGINFDYTEKKSVTVNENYKSLYSILTDTARYYQNTINTKDGDKAIEYLKERGFKQSDIKEFDIGLSSFNYSLYSFLNKKGYKDNDIIKTGLISADKNIHDVFVERIMIPIHDIDGNVVGFTGRIYKPNDNNPKYINSKETEVFKKGKILFNFHRAKPFIRSNHEIIIVEGNMDAIKLYINGVKNVVALMGTALTSDQIDVIKKLKCKVTLMLDSDSAGKLGMYQNGNLLRKSGIEPNIVLLSGAKDPDEYINNFGIEKLLNLVKTPMSFINYKLEYLKGDLNLDDVADLTRYIKLVINDLKQEDDKLTIEVVLKKLAKEYNIEYDNLISNFQFNEDKQTKPDIKLEDKTDNQVIKIDEAVANIILGMMTDGKYIKQFIKQLGIFPEKWQRNIVNEIRYYYDKNKTINVADFISYLSDKLEMQSVVLDIISKYGDLEITDELFTEYITAEKNILLNKEIKELMAKIKNETDINKKVALGEELTKLKKEVGNKWKQLKP